MLRKQALPVTALLTFTTVVLALGLGVTVPASAQSINGAIAGVVTDVQGGALRGATVTARNADTALARSSQSDGDGRYRLAGLPPGRYDLRTEREGFAPVDVKNLTVTIGVGMTRDISMPLPGVPESASVTAAAPVIDTSKVDVSGVITGAQINGLPLASRQPVALALLLPGTSQDAVRPRKFNVNLGAGAFANAAAFLIDGVWNKEGVSGEPRQDFPQAAIREFTVSTSNAGAEYGWRAGGAVTIATKSGTNHFTGEAFEYFRDKSLNASNRFEKLATETKGTPKPNYRRDQFGLAIGGPIVTDRLHFFGSVERTDEKKFITVNTGKPAFYSGLEGTFAEPEYSNTYFGKVDWQPSTRQNLFVRYAGQQQDYTCDSCGGTAALNTDGGINQPRRSFAGGHTWAGSSRIVNELRAQHSFYGYYAHPSYDSTVFDFGTYPAERTAQFARTFTFPSLTYGWTTGGPNLYVRQWTKEIRDDVSIVAGRHTFKVGGAIRSMPARDDLPQSVGT